MRGTARCSRAVENRAPVPTRRPADGRRSPQRRHGHHERLRAERSHHITWNALYHSRIDRTGDERRDAHAVVDAVDHPTHSAPAPAPDRVFTPAGPGTVSHPPPRSASAAVRRPGLDNPSVSEGSGRRGHRSSSGAGRGGAPSSPRGTVRKVHANVTPSPPVASGGRDWVPVASIRSSGGQRASHPRNGSTCRRGPRSRNNPLFSCKPLAIGRSVQSMM